MSLDVWLTIKSIYDWPDKQAIYIREDGEIKEISRAEWDERHPDREPIVVNIPETEGECTVFDYNITHNLGRMAREAGVYEPLWRPEEIGITKALDLIQPLREGLARLEKEPEQFKEFNPSNGWGTYEGLVDFVRAYLEACEEYPGASVSTWR